MTYTTNDLNNAELIDAIDSWIAFGKTYEEAYELATENGSANDYEVNELAVQFGIPPAELNDAIDSWIALGKTCEEAYQLATESGSANDYEADELAIQFGIPHTETSIVIAATVKEEPQVSRGAKGRIERLMAQLKEQQRKELETTAAIFTVAQVAVNELRKAQ